MLHAVKLCSLIIEAWYTVALTMLEHYLGHVEKRSESSETVSSIQPDRQPANAVPRILESICKSVESEADPLNLVNV